MKYSTFLIFWSTLFLTITYQVNAADQVGAKQWINTWEQTDLSKDTVKKECKIDKLLKFHYVFEQSKKGNLEGFFVQTDYRINVTSPPNPACEFTNTQSANVLLNEKRWEVEATVSEKNNTLKVFAHSGKCKYDHCLSPNETDFETLISMGNGYVIDNFGTSNAADDILLLGNTQRDAFLSAAKKVAVEAENYLTKNNCSQLYKMLKKSNRKKLADNYVETCAGKSSSKRKIKSYAEVDRFLSFSPNQNHWAVIVNDASYIDGTKKKELMYLVFEDNIWKFWGVY